MISDRLIVDVSAASLEGALAKRPEVEWLCLHQVPNGYVLPEAVLTLSKLTALSLRGAESTLEFPSNGGALKVTTLELLTPFKAASLPAMPGVETLIFSPTSVADEVIAVVERFSNLKKLVLMPQALSHQRLPDELAKLRALEELIIDRCGVTQLPASLAKVRLARLSLFCPQLSVLPEVVCQVRSLEALTLGLKLDTLPESLSQLTVLRELDLRGVLRPPELPPVLGKLIRLERFNLADCGVRNSSGLDQLFARLTKLKRLNLAGAEVTSLEFLRPCLLLEELSLEGVKAAPALLEQLALLPRLQRLTLSNTDVRSLAALENLPELTRVELENVELDDGRALLALQVALMLRLQAREGDLCASFVEAATAHGVDAMRSVAVQLGLEGESLYTLLHRAVKETAVDELITAVTVTQLEAWADSLGVEAMPNAPATPGA